MAYPPITSLGTVPQRTQTPAEFATNGDSFLGALPNFRTELNAFGAYIDSSGAEIEADKAAAQASALQSQNSASASDASAALALSYKDLAAGTANFKGSWSALTGSLAVPASVYHNGLTWVLLSNLANVTAAEPGISASWVVASGESFTRYVDSLFSRALLDFNFARNKYFAYERYGIEPKQLTSVLQTIRASNETYTGPFNVQSVGADTPSIQYNATTGESLGINTRPASTNLLLHSQYTAASGETPPTGWVIAFSTGVTTTAASPRFSGAIRSTQSGTTNRECYEQTVTLAALTTYTLSCYFANGTIATDVVMRAVSVGGADTPSGTTILNGSSVTSAGTYAITFTTGAVGGSYFVRIGLGCVNNATGTVIHETPQLEVGSFYTGYIPTTTAQVTRAATQVRRDLANAFALNGGVLYVEFIAQAFGNLERLIAIGDTSTTQECSINYGSGADSNKLFATIRVSGVNTNLSVGTFTSGVLYKAAVRYVRNSDGTYSWSFWLNGAAGTSVTTTALPTGYDKLGIGCRRYNSATLQPYTPIKRAVYLGGIFSNADMQALTA